MYSLKKIELNANNDKRIQSGAFIETYAYRRSKDIIHKNEETIYRNKLN